MTEMNPYYARPSKVGPVFDVATWNTRFAFMSIFMSLGMLLVFSAAAYLFYDPSLLAKSDAKILRDLHRETLSLWKDHPNYAQAGLGVGVFLAYFGLAAAVAMVSDFFDPNFYLRVGSGGMSLRVPNGLDFLKLGFVTQKLELDLPWHEINNWQVTQKKQFGAMSANAGNISAHLTIRTTAGKKYLISLDHFKENGHIIWKRMGDASEMTSLQFDTAPESTTNDLPTASGAEESGTVIEAVLIKQLYSQQSSIVFSDAATGKFVQFAVGGGEILLDLPSQALDETETQRANDYFNQLGHRLQTSELLDQPGGVAVGTQESFQLDLGSDVERAAGLALEIFHSVYRLPEDFSLIVEEV